MGDINEQQNEALNDIIKALDGYATADVDVKVQVNDADSTAQFLADKLTAGSNITITEVDTGGVISLRLDVPDSSPAVGTDTYNFYVSAGDTTPGFLEDKLIAGSGVTFTKNDLGGNESITVDVLSSVVASVVEDGYKLKISQTDGVPGFLQQKLIAGSNVNITKSDIGGEEILTIDVPDGVLVAALATADGYNVKVSLSDSTPEFLQSKLVAGSNMSISKVNTGGVETLVLDVAQQDVSLLASNQDDFSDAIQTIRKDLDGYVPDNPTFQENKSYWNDAIKHLVSAADAYGIGATESEHYQQMGSHIQTILKDLDGYNQTISEHYTQHSNAFGTILKDLDGYRDTINEHYTQHSEAIQTMLKDLDGYATDANLDALAQAVIHLRDSADGYQSQLDGHDLQLDAHDAAFADILPVLDGYGATIDSHYRENSETFNTIVKQLDGYESKISAQENYIALGGAINSLRQASDGYQALIGGINSTESEHYTQMSEHISTIRKAVDGYFIAGAINQDLLPDTDNAYQIGNGTYRWKSLYLHGDNGLHIQYPGEYTGSVRLKSIINNITGTAVAMMCGHPNQQTLVLITAAGIPWKVDLTNNNVATLGVSEFPSGIKSLWMDSAGWVYYIIGSSSKSTYTNDTLYKLAPPYTSRTLVYTLPALATNFSWFEVKMSYDESIIGFSKRQLTSSYTSSDSIIYGERFFNWNSSSRAVGSQIYDSDRSFTQPLGFSSWPSAEWAINHDGTAYYREQTWNDPDIEAVTLPGGSASTIFTDPSPSYDAWGSAYYTLVTDPDDRLYAWVASSSNFSRLDTGTEIAIITDMYVINETCTAIIGPPQSEADVPAISDIIPTIFYSGDSGNPLNVYKFGFRAVYENREYYLNINKQTDSLELFNTYYPNITRKILSIKELDGYIGINNSEPNEALTVSGVISLAGISKTPDDTDGYGKIYVRSADNHLYYKGSDGVAIDLTSFAATTESEHYTQLGNAISTIIKDLDGYAQNQTVTQHYNQLSSTINTIVKDLDGYASKITEAEHYTQHNSAISTILKDLDGYAVDSGVSENFTAISQAIIHLRDSADGYQSQLNGLDSQVDAHDAAFADILPVLDGYGTTIDEHYQQHLDAIQTILKDLDGYAADSTVAEHYVQHSDAIQTILKDLDGYVITSEGADGYLTFFTGANSIAGDNDLRFNREENRVYASKIQVVNEFRVPSGGSSGYVLTSDNSGIGTWQPAAAGGSTDFNKIVIDDDTGTVVVDEGSGNVVSSD
jgi:hypothetical protein